MGSSTFVTIGVLALQGAFAEHLAILTRLQLEKPITAIAVRTSEELARCAALIIPGGESTTIALLAKLAGLLEPLRDFVKTKPVWGTCAGAILLSEAVIGGKKGGQDLLGGIDVTVGRNGFGSQVESFEASLAVDGLREQETDFVGVFIRAPIVLSMRSAEGRPPIKVIARLAEELLPEGLEPLEKIDGLDPRTVVALRQGQHLLTTFHPELTRDDRFHEYFVRSCVFEQAGTRC